LSIILSEIERRVLPSDPSLTVHRKPSSPVSSSSTNGQTEANLRLGKDYIAVVDSLTFMGDAAEDWAYTITPSGSKGPDGRMVIYQAQKAVESVISLVTSEAFRCNVIVTAHIAYIDMPDGSKRGHPVAPGSKLSPSIPRYFNNYALMKSDGGKRTLQTVSDAFIDLKKPVRVQDAAKAVD
jgi:hypothetical protein